MRHIKTFEGKKDKKSDNEYDQKRNKRGDKRLKKKN